MKEGVNFDESTVAGDTFSRPQYNFDSIYFTNLFRDENFVKRTRASLKD